MSPLPSLTPPLSLSLFLSGCFLKTVSTAWILIQSSLVYTSLQGWEEGERSVGRLSVLFCMRVVFPAPLSIFTSYWERKCVWKFLHVTKSPLTRARVCEHRQCYILVMPHILRCGSPVRACDSTATWIIAAIMYSPCIDPVVHNTAAQAGACPLSCTFPVTFSTQCRVLGCATASPDTCIILSWRCWTHSSCPHKYSKLLLFR